MCDITDLPKLGGGGGKRPACPLCSTWSALPAPLKITSMAVESAATEVTFIGTYICCNILTIASQRTWFSGLPWLQGFDHM